MKVMVGLSGGVDSSVAAFLLQQQGHKVIGATMRIYSDELKTDARMNACYGPDDEEIAKAAGICKTLGIEHHILDLREEYKHIVLDYFKEEYFAGRTPNPCIKCNRKIKFELMLIKARQKGAVFDRFATGHYARLDQNPETKRFLLKKGQDPARDQSYFLCMLSQEQLALLLFPLGDFTKDQVREIAQEHGLPTYDEPDSQDFFAGDYAELLQAKELPGPIKNVKGEILGSHKGIWSYTVGQRKGLGIAHEKPLYVLHIDARNNTLIVGTEDELYRQTLVAREVNWIACERPHSAMAAQAKIRSSQEAIPCTLEPLDDGRIQVIFKDAQRAVTPGQTIVAYDGDTVICGGVIE